MIMCSYQEWERFTRRAERLIDEDQVREFAERAAAKLEALAEELRVWASRSATDWAGGCDRRSRPEWVAFPTVFSPPAVGYGCRLDRADR